MLKNIIIGSLLGAVIALGVSACESGGSVPIGPGQSVSTSSKFVQIELLSRPCRQGSVRDVPPITASRTRLNPIMTRPSRERSGHLSTTVAGRSAQTAAALQSLLYPNEMIADLSQSASKAAYLGVETGGLTGSTFGGRALSDDVIAISLGAIFGSTPAALGFPDDMKESPCLATDNVAYGSTTSTTFPYAQAPI